MHICAAVVITCSTESFLWPHTKSGEQHSKYSPPPLSCTPLCPSPRTSTSSGRRRRCQGYILQVSKANMKQLLPTLPAQMPTLLREQHWTGRTASQHTFITIILYSCVIFTVYGDTILFMKYTQQLHIWLYYFQHFKCN